MLEDLLLHPTTRLALQAFSKQPPHALLLIGPTGMGKRTLAEAWAWQVSQSPPQVVEPDERGTIPIEAIRGLYRAVRSKHSEPQVIIVDHAESLSLEAEHAFLKLLEEPRPGVTFVLTAPHTDALLPTVLSRTQRVVVQPLAQPALAAFADSQNGKFTPAELAQLLFIARGRPAAFVRLLQQSDTLATERHVMQQAKALLTARPYERFVFASTLSNDRQACTAVLEAMLHMSCLQLKKSDEPAVLGRWLRLSQALEQALGRLRNNANLKAQLLKLFVSY